MRPPPLLRGRLLGSAGRLPGRRPAARTQTMSRSVSVDLPAPGRAGEPHGVGRVGPVGQPGHRPGGLPAPLDEREQPGQRDAVARTRPAPTARPGRRSAALAAHRARHPGARASAARRQVLVAAVDVVGPADHRLALGDQAGQHERRPGADVGRAHRGAREPRARHAPPRGGPRCGCPHPSGAAPRRSGTGRRRGSRSRSPRRRPPSAW